MPHVRRWGSRALVTGLLAIFGSGLLLVPASAQSSSDDATALRTDAEQASGRYFTALERAQSLDDEITRNEQQVDELLARAKEARDAAKARALIAYTSAGSKLSTLVDSEDTLDSARHAQLIDRVNARDEDVFNTLTRATRALHKQQRELHANREAQSDALDTLKAEGAEIDAKLAQAVAHEQQAQAAAATTAPTTATTDAGASATRDAASTTVPAPTSTTVAPPPAPRPPPAYSGTPGASAHHDDRFLSCVRARESGGNYGVVNPAGPYLGAYQFLQATWNVTAAHAGRADLVGVPPNQASPYDQDEMAWSLYQWQGAGPWGGGC